MSSSTIESFPVVVLEKGKARLFQEGNPIIYGGAIKEVKSNSTEVCVGDEVLVQDHMANNIGRGLFNPYSTYRVRMMARSYEPTFQLPLNEILLHRIQAAKSLRSSIGLGDPSTTVYRLINGEGDRLGGLVIDCLGKSIIIQSSACWVERYRDLIERVVRDVFSSTPDIRVIWRQAESRLKQDGFEHPISDNVIIADSNRSEIVTENEVKYQVYPESLGQKTGFYADQRENRQLIHRIAKGKSVLDTYCYSGGFSLNAALGGATKITAVDSSAVALDLLRENIVLNNLSEERISIVKADAVEYMKILQTKQEFFDFVICDPPKLAPSRSALEKAKSKYVKINSLALSIVKPGGLLFTCTCSAAVTQTGEFKKILSEAARISRRDVTVVSTSGAATDHPVHIAYEEGNYLTAVLLRVL